MAAGSYYLDGILHTAAAQSITLATADGTNPRIDVLYLDTEGVLQKITGTPASSPSKPAVEPTSQLELTFVLVPAGATSLSAVTTENIYLENVEWTASQSGTALNLASTNNPYSGSVCIETTGVFGTGNYVNFARASNEAFGGDGNLILRIRSKTTWNAKRTIVCQFYCDGVAVGQGRSIRTGVDGFDSSITNAYQAVIIPKSAFALAAGTEIDALRITCAGSGNSVPSFYLDSIQLQTNGTAIGNSDLTQSVADARYVNVTGDEMTGDLVVPDEAYGVGWNGSREVPTKNAVYDAVSSISGGTLGALLVANNLSDVANAATARSNIGAAPLSLTISTVSGATYTAVLGAAGTHIRFTNGTGVAFTVPPNSSVAFPVGTRIRGTQAGAGIVTLTPGAGVTLNSRDGVLTSAGQYAVFEVEKVATNEWDVLGDVA